MGAVTALGSGGEKLGNWKLRLQLAGFEESSCMNSIIIPERVRFVPPLLRRFKGGQRKKKKKSMLRGLQLETK